MKEPKKPIFDCLLYRWFNIETSRYQRYWKNYCKFIQYLIIMDRPDYKSVVS